MEISDFESILLPVQLSYWTQLENIVLESLFSDSTVHLPENYLFFKFNHYIKTNYDSRTPYKKPGAY